jgi:predicted NUDIX family phosphoesterase/thymidylate kinase
MTHIVLPKATSNRARNGKGNTPMNEHTSDFELQKARLRELATSLTKNLDEVKRPLVIEFSGTPKAGKTTCVDAISKFFRRHRIPTYKVTERASVCPISDKTNFFFNIWTGNSSLNQMIAVLEQRVKIIVLDRGLFDTLVWMELHRTIGSLPSDMFSKIEAYFLMWANSVDIVVALSVDPDVSLQREFKDQITDIQGSIMNLELLSSYNERLHYCLEKYESSFRRIIPMDTTNRKPVDGVAAIAFEVLAAASNLVDEEIAVVDLKFVRDQIPSNGVILKVSEVFGFEYKLVDKVKWVRRTEAEEDSVLVQLIPVAVIRQKGKILVINARGVKHGTLINRNMIWAGGHVRKGDVKGTDFSWATFRDCLLRELREELQLPPNLANLSQHPKAIVWDNTDPRSMQHLALFYEYSGDFPPAALHLREHYESSAKSLFTEFRPLDQALAQLPDWESWSVLYLNQVHKISFPKKDRQTMLL